MEHGDVPRHCRVMWNTRGAAGETNPEKHRNTGSVILPDFRVRMSCYNAVQLDLGSL